jgi:hypothetical protein
VNHGLYSDPDPAVVASVEAFAKAIPSDHAFIGVVRRAAGAQLYMRSSGGLLDALTLMGLMDRMGGPFREAGNRIVLDMRNGQPRPRPIYPCSKIRHAPMWRELRGTHPIRATWLDADPQSDGDLRELWSIATEEAALSNVVVYAEPGDVLKGAAVEVGACLAGGGTVYVVGEPDALRTVRHHVRVVSCETVEEALNLAGGPR